MPYIVVDENTRVNIDSIYNVDYKYTYPRDSAGRTLNLRPSSALHQSLVQRILRYGMEADRVASRRRIDYIAMDETLTAYIPIDDKERLVKSKDRRKPVSIVFPYTYAIMETLLSYLVAAFFPEPLFRYEGNGPEDIAGALLMEKLINTHCNHTKVALNLHTMFRDSIAYGIGPTCPLWDIEEGIRVRNQDVFAYGPDGEQTVAGSSRVASEAILFEGNSLANIDPYCYLPDPAAPIHEPQRGAFVGWLSQSNLMDLLSAEEGDADLFNVKYLQNLNTRSNSLFGLARLARGNSRGKGSFVPRRDKLVGEPVDEFNCYVKLIPKQWQLGPEEVPEKWQFTLAADQVIVRARKLDMVHNRFPVTVTAPDFDGYSPVAYSRLEILSGMQNTIDFLFNSHISNVRKAINDVLIIDPYLINVNDLKDPGAGGLVRLRRPAWGKGVKDAVMQLNITDITRGNIQEVAAIIQYMQTIGGTDNPLMGSLRRGGPERLSSAEFQGTAQGAVNRLERVAKVVGLQGMQDIGMFFAYHAQQFMQEDTWVRTVGNWPETISKQFNVQEGRVLVRPRDIMVAYDLLVRDGSIPGGNFSESHVQLFNIIASNPQLLGTFDILRYFKFIATSLGAKNVDDFERTPPPQVNASTAPDDEILRQVEMGNLAPLGA